MGLEGTDLEGYLAHHHDMIILTSIEESRQLAEQHLQSMQRRWMDNEWESSKAAFMQSLGHRAHRWGVNIPNSAPAALSLCEPEKPSTMAAPNKVSTKPLHNSILQDHADAVSAINRASAAGQPIDACRTLHIAAKGLDHNSNDAQGYRQLLATLEHMVGENCTGRGGVEAGYFSPICFEKEHVPVIQRNERKSHLSCGFKQFLEGQQLELWDKAIQTAIRDGDIRLDERHAGTTMLHRLRRFVNYLYRIEHIPNHSDLVTISNGPNGAVKTLFTPSTAGIGGHRSTQGVVRGAATTSVDVVPFWALIYHYLRAGKLDLAVEEASETHPVLPGEKDIAIVLKAMLDDKKRTAGPTRTPAKTNNSQSEKVSAAMKGLESLYREDMMKDPSCVDPYRTAIFNFVGLVDKRCIVSCAIPQFNLDDFLWANMWFIEMSRSVSISAPQFHSPFASRTHTYGGISSTDTIVPAAVDGEHELLEMILALGGANHFDPHRNSPFMYVLLLFACQRFGDAIVYLWQADKVFYAAHLTVVCLHYGLILPHAALHQNPIHPLVSSYYQTNVHDAAAFGALSHPSSSGTNAAQHAFSLTPLVVLNNFLNHEHLQQSADTCFAYLISLNSNWLKNCHLPYQSAYDKDYREAHRLKSHEVVSSAIETFLMTLNLAQLNVVIGKLEDAQTISMKLTGTLSSPSSGTIISAFHSHGSIEDYIPDSRDVDTHLMNIARKFLVQHHDAESAKHFFALAGKWKEVVEVLSDELMTNIKLAFTSFISSASAYNLISGNNSALSSTRDQSAFWMQQADNFIREYIQVPQSAVGDLISRAGHQESLDFLFVLMQVYYFFSAFRVDKDPLKALNILDGLELVPSIEDHLRSIGPIHARLRGIIDDLLMVVMEVIRTAYQTIKARMPPTGNVAATNAFLAERESSLQGIRLRSRVLAKYVQMAKTQLSKSDATVQYISRIDALLI